MNETADPKRELRLFTVKRDWSTTPKEEGVTGHWSELSPKEVGDFSAVAYFFGDLLQRSLDVPVGLIHCSWSASKIETWMDKETLQHFPEVHDAIATICLLADAFPLKITSDCCCNTMLSPQMEVSLTFACIPNGNNRQIIHK